MKVLWISNYHFPDVCKRLKIPEPVVGGWMYAGASNLLLNNPGINLAVASHYSGKKLISFSSNGISYFLLPEKLSNKYSKSYETHWKEISNVFKPEIVHIHGSEYPNGLAYIRACGNKGVVVSIQGMVSVYERYYFGSISDFTFLRNITLRDILRWDTIFRNKRQMKKRGLYESELIRKVCNVIGRTEWDKSHCWSINPQAKYYFCNESLRSVFYENNWTLDNCERNSIFLSQAFYPIKGFHILIQALPLILREYPNTKVYISGDSYGREKRFTKNGYNSFLNDLIIKNKCQNNIVYVGKLRENEMCDRFIKSHIFVCPSSIENSANSIGEAQLLGVPCIGSYVGGTMDLIENNQSGFLYRFEEFEMLASIVCRLFSDDKLAKRISESSRKVSAHRHDMVKNAKNLGFIYNSINQV